jgi:hypothetical protein
MAENSPHRTRDPWERRPDEEPHQYQAFEIYMNLPPEKRSLKQAYRLYIDNPDAAGPSDNFKGWAKRYNWKVRATAWDDAKAHARYEAQICGVENQWEKMAAEREQAHANVIELTNLAYDKAREIYEKELDKDNYSMGHAVQMSKFVLECYRMLLELEKIHAAHAKDEWTEEDDREMAELMERFEAQWAEEDAAAEFFEEQWRKQKEEEDEGPEDSQA